MNSDQVRERFLTFFIERGHKQIPSATLVPWGDPTLLFTSAGMVQFKPFFTGKDSPPALRMTSVQRCFRTSDIESVGDVSHHTFFEMLGNFSVGDYFKDQAISWAWEFVTKELGIPAERLWNTVYTDDDQAFDLWVGQGQKPEKIFRYGEAEGNFWTSGDLGPCGPCSEIFYDFGEAIGCGPDCEPAHENCYRFLEIWNLVFMSMYQDENGERTPLPKANIDTGAGLERITRVLEDSASSYETDLFDPILRAISDAIGVEYGKDEESRRMMRVIADHARAVTFLVADGVLPTNEGRGYVVRRLIRRSVYYGRVLAAEGPFLAKVADAVIDRMKRYYPFLDEQRTNVHSALTGEERRFGDTLEAGVTRLDGLIASLRGQGDALPGDEIFRLYSTYGVPLEVIEEIAEQHGLNIDREGFESELERERERGRAGGEFLAEATSQARLELAGTGRGGRFIGYESLQVDTAITGIFAGSEVLDRANAGRQIQVVLDATPFYPEGGGQVGDAGEIRTESGVARVTDTQRDEGLILHEATVVDGTIAVQQLVAATVDPIRRRNTTRNHTGTHLLHAALREVLGRHVRQMGSLVAPDRLRFDYQQPQAPTNQQRLEVEHLVNEKIREDIPVATKVMNKEAALGEGVLAFFGDKYGDEVRVVEMVDSGHRFSAELCGGTHVDETGELGLLLLVNDASIGAGVRRVEALTGSSAERYIEEQLARIDRLSRTLGVPPTGLEARVEGLVAELEAVRRQQALMQREAGRQNADSLVASAERIGGAALIIARVNAPNVESLRQIGDVVRQKVGSSVVVLTGASGKKPPAMVMVSSDLSQKVKAADVLNKGLVAAEARGGGRPELAQGGINNPAALDRAFEDARRLVKELLSD
ncbi:MAG TPA: alanine--tRNA ligase [Dehalococcoidia bacterium]